MPDIATGQVTLYFPAAKRRVRVVQSIIAMFFMTLTTIGIVAALYVLQDVLFPYYGTDSQSIVSILNAVQIIVFNQLYTSVAIFLTTRENHRTDDAYGDYLAAKMFIFRFINSFASFFYIAFIAPYLIPASGTFNPGDMG